MTIEPTAIDRTPQAARSAIADAYEAFQRLIEEEAVKSIVTRELVDEVLNLAWRHQFDEDRLPVQRKLQELIVDRVSELEVEGHLP